MACKIVGPGGKTARVSNTSRLILLGMVPLLLAKGESQGALGREEADGHGFLRNGGSGRDLQSASECGVDFSGVRSSGGTGKFCCVEECGVCGGDGCSDFAKELGYNKEHCCTSAIKEKGVLCSDSMAAPCMIGVSDAEPPEQTPEPMAEPAMNYDYEFVRCSTMETEDAGETAFFYTMQDDNLMLSTCYEDCAKQSALYFAALEGNVCACGDSAEFLEATAKPVGVCDMACPGGGAETCGGSSSYDLYSIPATDGGGYESGDGDGDALPTCSSGIVGVESESGDICCDHKCGECGGDKCVGWGECCEETIQVGGEMCSETNVAPCIYNKVHVETPQPAPVPESAPREERLCSNGLAGVESVDGATCCWDGCLECSGYGEDCVGVTNCCEQAIHDAGVYCSDEGVEEGPCIM